MSNYQFKQKLEEWSSDKPVKAFVAFIAILMVYLFLLMFAPWAAWQANSHVAIMVAIAFDVGLIVAGGMIGSMLGWFE